MKSRKVLSHAELISEVLNATKSRGALQPAEIKGEIEKYVLCPSLCFTVPRGICYVSCLTIPFFSRLIEKDYMERKGTNSYSYVA